MANPIETAVSATVASAENEDAVGETYVSGALPMMTPQKIAQAPSAEDLYVAGLLADFRGGKATGAEESQISADAASSPAWRQGPNIDIRAVVAGELDRTALVARFANVTETAVVNAGAIVGQQATIAGTICRGAIVGRGAYVPIGTAVLPGMVLEDYQIATTPESKIPDDSVLLNGFRGGREDGVWISRARTNGATLPPSRPRPNIDVRAHVLGDVEASARVAKYAKVTETGRVEAGALIGPHAIIEGRVMRGATIGWGVHVPVGMTVMPGETISYGETAKAASKHVKLVRGNPVVRNEEN